MAPCRSRKSIDLFPHRVAPLAGAELDSPLPFQARPSCRPSPAPGASRQVISSVPTPKESIGAPPRRPGPPNRSLLEESPLARIRHVLAVVCVPGSRRALRDRSARVAAVQSDPLKTFGRSRRRASPRATVSKVSTSSVVVFGNASAYAMNASRSSEERLDPRMRHRADTRDPEDDAQASTWLVPAKPRGGRAARAERKPACGP